MNKVKFAIAGFGKIGKRHAEHITRQGQLVAVCDSNAKALEEAKILYPGVQVFGSVEQLLRENSDAEIINICTPNGLHAEHTIRALKAGRHVVCEKPMALSTNDCNHMIEESVIAQKYLFVVKQNRYNPPVQALKKIIDEGSLGNIFSAQLNCFWNRGNEYYSESPWKGTKDMDGGILYTQFSHFIDLFQWLLGSVKQVNSMAGKFRHDANILFDDTLVSIVKFETGVIGTMNFTINSYKENMEGSITVFGEKGTVKVGGQYLNVLEYQSLEGMKIQDLPESPKPNIYGNYQGSMSNHDKVISNVIDVISHGELIAVNGFDGLKTIDLIQNIYNNIL